MDIWNNFCVKIIDIHLDN